MTKSRRARTLYLALAIAMLSAMSFAAASAMASPFVVQTLSPSLTASDLAQSLVGAGVSISNVQYVGADAAAGSFSGGDGILDGGTTDFKEGVVLSSGFAAGIVGPNSLGNFTGDNGLAGDSDLTTLAGASTYDAAALEFDFTPGGDKIYFEYVFSSEEYNEWVNLGYNDVFGFYVNGVNYATIGNPAVAVSVDTINNGLNSASYVDNTDGHLNTQMDGLTVKLVFEAPVNKDVPNHMKLAIADSGDYVLDSDVFIKAGSISIVKPVDTEGPITSNVAVTPMVVPVGAMVTVTAGCDDSTTGNSNIASAEVWVTGKVGWAPLYPADGAFDSPTENVIHTLGSFTTPGVYQVAVRATDSEGNLGEPHCTMLVVYDPCGGFVTGGGWIMSPAGAYVADPCLYGKATFGFVSKFQKGATVPTGNTEFQFHAGDLNFKSTSYDWLVVAGARAQYKGLGTINGEGNYGFMLTAIDGQVNGGGGYDKLRLKIWDIATGDIVYDTQKGATDCATVITGLQGGSIVIHK